MKQRIYLPAEVASLLHQRSAQAGVSAELYLQGLILQNHICGAGQPPAALSQAQELPAEDIPVTLSGDWATL